MLLRVATTVLWLAVAGCSMQPEERGGDDVGPDVSVGAPEKLRWIGQHADELIGELGEPQQILEATLLGGPASVALVYLSDSEDDCIDAYVIIQETGKVAKYFCR